MESGLVISLRFGQGCTIGSTRIEPIEPVAGFKVFGGGTAEEYYLPVLTQSGSIPYEGDNWEWLVYRHSFTSINCTLGLVNSEWLATSKPGEDFPPGIRMEFTERKRELSWNNTRYKWLGNGIDIKVGDDLHTMLEGDSIKFIVEGFTVKMQLENIKGKSGAQLRFDKPFTLKLQRDL